MCRTCKTECDDVLNHLMTVHKFSKKIVEDQLIANPNSYKNSFEELKNDRSKTTIKAKSKKLKK